MCSMRQVDTSSLESSVCTSSCAPIESPCSMPSYSNKMMTPQRCDSPRCLERWWGTLGEWFVDAATNHGRTKERSQVSRSTHYRWITSLRFSWTTGSYRNQSIHRHYRSCHRVPMRLVVWEHWEDFIGVLTGPRHLISNVGPSVEGLFLRQCRIPPFIQCWLDTRCCNQWDSHTLHVPSGGKSLINSAVSFQFPLVIPTLKSTRLGGPRTAQWVPAGFQWLMENPLVILIDSVSPIGVTEPVG